VGRVTAVSHEDDLALLSVPGITTTPAALRRLPDLQVGESVSTYGFPFGTLLSSEGVFSTGVVSALRAMQDDGRRVQVSVPVQAGSSGSPLLDASGSVVGVIQSKLNAARVLAVFGDLPEGISFAVSPMALKAFLDRERIRYRTADTRGAPGAISPTSVAQTAQRFVVRVECVSSLPPIAGDGLGVRRPLGEPPAILSIAEFRARYPMYHDLSDSDLAERLRTRLYSDLNAAEFAALFFAGRTRPRGLPALQR
jgi:hypothetical protein